MKEPHPTRMFATWTAAPEANESKPINCTTWYEALAFCAWDGGFLPTEAERHYAASGGTDQRAYPWSFPADSLDINSTHASYDDEVSASYLTAVGTKPAGDGRWGQADLGGNVWEVVLDFSAPRDSTPCNDCANLVPTPKRALGGGGFRSIATALRVGLRQDTLPSDRDHNTGVRCARTP